MADLSTAEVGKKQVLEGNPAELLRNFCRIQDWYQGLNNSATSQQCQNQSAVCVILY